MAASVSKDSLSTLRITYEALEERNKLMMTDYSAPLGTAGESSDKSRTTRGILYVPPTTDLVPKENRGRRHQGKSSCDQTRSVTPQSRLQLSDRVVGATREKTPSGKRSKAKQEYRGSERHERTRKSAGGSPRDGPDKTAGQDLSCGWSQHEHKRVERALSKWSGDLAKLDPVIRACHRVQECAKTVLGKDMEAFTKLDISTKLWKQGHYPIIEALRGKKSVDCSAELETFLTYSVEFYSHLLGQVESQLSFRVSELLSSRVEFTSKTHCRKVMLAAVLCHHWCICLGDLSRYQQQYLLAEDADWSKPRRYYQQAQQLVPKAGKPYNQLAIIAINTHRRLDAIYYYMRSLSTRPAFLSAYDSLVGIFADTSRKAKKLEEDERRTGRRKEAEAARKLKREEQKQRKKRSRQCKQRSQREPDRHEDRGRGTVVQEFISGKKEIWIMPGASRYEQEKLQSHDVSQDAGTRSHDGTAADLESPISPSPQVLVRKMTSAFVQIHGKLFTRTGLERLLEATQRMLRYCGELLRVEGRLRVEYALLLLKMTAINIFAIHHAADTYADSPSARVHHCGVSLGLSLQVAAVLLVACVERLKTIPIATPTDSEPVSSIAESAEGVELLDYLAVLLPAVRVLLDWFLCQEELRSISHTAVKQPILLEFWTVLVTFLNLTSEVVWPGFQDAQPTRLWEERALAGFIHLKATLSTKDTFTIADMKRMSGKEHRQQSIARVFLLNSLCQQLCEADGVDINITGIRGATLSFNKESKQFSLLDTGGSCGAPLEAGLEGEEKGGGEGEGMEEREGGSQPFDESFELEVSFGFSDSDDDVVEILSVDEEEGERVESEVEGTRAGMERRVESEVEMVSAGQSTILPMEKEGDTEIEQLKAQRDDLVKQMEENTLARAVAKTVLGEAASKASREMLITPKYLVPDTNCFVDMLPSIRTLVGRAEFVVAIPLIVINELEGLSRGADAASGLEKRNLAAVTSGAKSALDYIRTSFHAKVPYLKALTTQGSLLPTLAFRDQLTEKASNDDLILESCLQLHIKTMTTKPGDHGSSTDYKVVMLTGDRNLRVKAHASDQPVKDITNFMKLL